MASQPDNGGHLRSKPERASRFYSSVWTFDGPSDDVPYRWYGTLPEQLVARLIELYAAEDNASVLDPFAGSGTTAVVAQRAKIACTALDINPLAVLTSQVRLGLVPGSSELQEAMSRIDKRTSSPSFQREVVKSADQHLGGDRFAYSRKWFREDTLRRLWEIGAAIAREEQSDVQRSLFVALAGAVRDVANIDPRCTHHLVTKRKPYIDPLPRIGDTAWSQTSTATAPSQLTTLFQGDVRTEVLDPVFDLAIVHPPYLGVINYHWIHRPATDLLEAVQGAFSPPSLELLDFNHPTLKAADMSSDRQDRYEAFVADIADRMAKATELHSRCAVIVGDQRHKGLLRHSFTTFTRLFEAAGFALEENFIWVLQNNGGMHVLRRGHYIDHNYILVFQRVP